MAERIGHNSRRFILGLFIVQFLLFSFSVAQAADYGSGDYGGGSYSVGEEEAAAETPAVSATTHTTGSSASAIMVSPGVACPAGLVCTPVKNPDPVTPLVTCPDMELGYRGTCAARLQEFLNNNGFPIAVSGPGSPGNETLIFGTLTKSALAAFQLRNSISPAIGNFGPLTRAFIQGLSPVAAPQVAVQPNIDAPFSFTRDLTLNSTGEDVRQLQIFLNTHGFTIAQSGPGSAGNETTLFGLLTQRALAQFQAANDINPPAGYFGPKTRAFVDLHN